MEILNFYWERENEHVLYHVKFYFRKIIQLESIATWLSHFIVYIISVVNTSFSIHTIHTMMNEVSYKKCLTGFWYSNTPILLKYIIWLEITINETKCKNILANLKDCSESHRFTYLFLRCKVVNWVEKILLSMFYYYYLFKTKFCYNITILKTHLC